MDYFIAVDGGVFPNPGRNAAVGMVVKIKEDDGFKIIEEISDLLPNHMEYSAPQVEWIALFRAIHWAFNLPEEIQKIVVYSDNDTVCKQFNGHFSIRKSKSYYDAMETIKLANECQFSVEVFHIARERNPADRLVKRELRKVKNTVPTGEPY